MYQVPQYLGRDFNCQKAYLALVTEGWRPIVRLESPVMWYLLIADTIFLITAWEFPASNKCQINFTMNSGKAVSAFTLCPCRSYGTSTQYCKTSWSQPRCGSWGNLDPHHPVHQDCHPGLLSLPSYVEGIPGIHVGEIPQSLPWIPEAVICSLQPNWSHFCPQLDQLRSPLCSLPPQTDQNRLNLLFLKPLQNWGKERDQGNSQVTGSHS